MDVENGYFPTSHAFFTDKNVNEVLTKSLLSSLSDIILLQNKKKKKDSTSYGKKKIITISHTIMSATRPKSFLSLLQLGLAIYIHANISRNYQSTSSIV